MSIKLLGRSAADNSTVTLTEPSSMTITRTYDSPAGMLEITFPCRESIPDLTDIQVNHNTDVLFRGYCDELIRSADGDGFFVTINARTPGSLLVDNEAKPTTYSNLTAKAFFDAEIAPLGFSSLTVPDSTLSVTSFQVNKGFSIWEAFTQLCFRLYGREPYITKELGIVVQALSTAEAQLISNNPAVSAHRYCALEYITRRSSALSSIIYRHTDGTYTKLMNNPFGNPLLVKRQRYVIPAAEFATSPGLDAYQRIIHGEKGVHSMRITLPKLYDVQPADAALVQTTQVGSQRMSVYQVKIIYNYTGCRTRLVLANPVYL